MALTSAPAAAPAAAPEQPSTACNPLACGVQLGQVVNVISRTGPGSNKPGGQGRVVKMHEDGSFDVKYVLGGREKNVTEELLVADEDCTARRAAAAAAAGISRAVAQIEGEGEAPSKRLRVEVPPQSLHARRVVAVAADHLEAMLDEDCEQEDHPVLSPRSVLARGDPKVVARQHEEQARQCAFVQGVAAAFDKGHAERIGCDDLKAALADFDQAEFAARLHEMQEDNKIYLTQGFVYKI
jgi:hypothetical protein